MPFKLRVFWQYWWKNHVIYIDFGKWWVCDFTHGNVCPVAFKKLAVSDAKPKMIAHKLCACYTSSCTIWSWVHSNLEIYMCKVEKHIEVWVKWSPFYRRHSGIYVFVIQQCFKLNRFSQILVLKGWRKQNLSLIQIMHGTEQGTRCLQMYACVTRSPWVRLPWQPE